MNEKKLGLEIYLKIEEKMKIKKIGKRELSNMTRMSYTNLIDTLNFLKKGRIRYKNIIKIGEALELDFGIRI